MLKPMNSESLKITEEKLARLREVVPEAFTEGEVDWERLCVSLGDGEFKDERYHLNWAGKTGAFRALQSPTTATLAPCREESVAFDETGNIFIEGENLTALKVLQKSYFGKIKMIYIDPPYNTGNDHFIYPDRFAESKSDYLKRIGDRNEAGRMTREGLFRKNSKENGHYHSNWLSMIYPRLFLARNLLREDGVIFVSIDDNEVHNLRMVMNEIFGEENFVGVLIWEKKKKPAFLNNIMGTVTEYVVTYAKSREKSPPFVYGNVKKGKKYPFNNAGNAKSILTFPPRSVSFRCPDGTVKSQDMSEGNILTTLLDDVVIDKGMNKSEFRLDGEWRYSQQTLNEFVESNSDIVISKVPFRPNYINYSGKEKKAMNLLSYRVNGVPTNEDATDEIRRLFAVDVMDYPKPSGLISRLLGFINLIDSESVILDFFAGSCTTAQAVLDLNKEDGGSRKFICVQMPEECEEKTAAYKAGYKTIADIGKERIRRVISNGKMNDGFKVFKLQESNFKEWRGDIKTAQELEKQMELHTDPVADEAKTEDIFYELLLKNGISLTAKMEDKGGWILVEDGELKIAIALDNIDDETVNAIMTAKPSKFITLDKLFRKNDQLKTNIALQMEDAGVGFDVV